MLGYRVLLPASRSLLQSLQMPTLAESDLQALRTLAGVPQGMEVAELMPLEWSLPLLHGVSFSKGCYVGQELVARTHFRGQVRKRLVPVYFTGHGAPPRPASFADPLEAASVLRPEEALLARRAGAAPGGHGRGLGHGPAQTHAFAEHGRAYPHAHAHSHIFHHASAPLSAEGHKVSSVLSPNATAASAASAFLHLPFPYLDRAWRGGLFDYDAPQSARKDRDLDSQQHASTALAFFSDGAASAAPVTPALSGGLRQCPGVALRSSLDGSQAQIGKVLCHVAGTNLGLAMVRLSNLGHALGQGAQASDAAAACAPALMPPAATASLEAEEAALDDPFSTASLQEMERLHAAARAPQPNERQLLRWEAGTPGTDRLYRVQPLLPHYWRKVPALPADEAED
jgi:folate-binding protein YgfZ